VVPPALTASRMGANADVELFRAPLLQLPAQ
jgi:hypothetical protein